MKCGLIPIHSFILKVVSRCNLNCKYCYVYNLADKRWREQPPLMTERVARQTAFRIREHCEAHNKLNVNITFHGGEPLLGGMQHLKMLYTVIKETFVDSPIRVTTGMQTNGLLFTPEIGDLMLSNKTSVGVSLDGPPEVNDVFRLDHDAMPISAKLTEKLSILTSPSYRQLFSGFLSVININADPLEVFRYLMSYQPPSVDFLFPHNNHDFRPIGKENDSDATPYGDWLIKIFDYWIRNKSNTEIGDFVSIIRKIFGMESLVESIGLDPVDLIVVETNGDIEAVDALKSTFDGATKLGYNVFSNKFDAVAADNRVQSRQIGAASLCQKCKECPVVRICGGGYLPHRYSSKQGFDNPSIYCSDIQKLIEHIYKFVLGEIQNIPIESFPK